LFVVLLIVAFFWVGLYLGRGYRPARPSIEMILPRGLRLFRGKTPVRRTQRVDLYVPIFVEGLDANGEKFEESTHTKTLSGYGAAIILARQLKTAEEIIIHRIDRSRQASVRVLHELATCPEGHIYGVAFVDPAADLWGACKLLSEAKQEPEHKADSAQAGA
jgi:hypothetical protein